MASSSLLKDVVHRPGLTKTQVLLVCLDEGRGSPKAVKKIRELAVKAGVRRASKWNISQLLDAAKGLCRRTDLGWELTDTGSAHVRSIRAGTKAPRVVSVATSLRSELGKLRDPNVREFVEEAMACLEAGLFRASVVFSWVGAIALLHAHVVANSLAAFNKEALRRNPKWKQAKTTDDLGMMKESGFLDVLQSISVIGKNVKQELQNCLKLRNGCGHPSSLKLGENRVAGHIEVLILNIYSRFNI
ncbi:hypothetical protein LCGC14_0181650 [marine sediment metagenome]|uniref:Uncharacterized protein n=1 Tax=marine sediment metagenome TaxID=412755 RepID=A0A0F9X7Z8_9ZZZZ